METKLISNNSENLIVFLTGWGCDDNQFELLSPKNCDVLICYDYSSLDFLFDFSQYKNFYLITFSAGVFMAGVLKEKFPIFKKTIAINGNPLAYDKYFGLSKEVIKAFSEISKENVFEFRRKYLVYDEKEFIQFNRFQSKRTIESSREELFALQKYSQQEVVPLDFDISILSDKDKVFNPSRQKEYWEKKAKKCIYLKNSGHFPFFRWNNYDEIINL